MSGGVYRACNYCRLSACWPCTWSTDSATETRCDDDSKTKLLIPVMISHRSRPSSAFPSLGLVSEPQGQVEEAREGRGAGPPIRPALPRPPCCRPSSQPLPRRRAIPSSPASSLGVRLDSCCGCSRCLPRPGPTSQQLCSTLGYPTGTGYLPGHCCHVPPPCLYRTHFWQVSCSCRDMNFKI